VASIVKRVVGGDIEFYGDPDRRSYRVSFRRARELLGFETIYSVDEGVKQIYHELLLGSLRQDPRWVTVEWYKKILRENPGAVEP
jgi:hypothetical protein